MRFKLRENLLESKSIKGVNVIVRDERINCKNACTCVSENNIRVAAVEKWKVFLKFHSIRYLLFRCGSHGNLDLSRLG